MSHSTRHHPLSAWLLALSLAALPAVSHATHSWGGYHWASTTRPVALMLGDNMTADWSSYLHQASADWDAGAQDAFTNSVVTGTSNKRCAAVTGTTQVCNGAYGTNGWLGLATISITGTHITKGTAKMNDTYFQTATYNNPNEKLHVVCQEVAHTFGLDHQSVDGSSLDTCMDYFSNTGANATSTLSTQPNAHDFEELDTIYAHTDSLTTVATTTTTSPGPGRKKLATDDSDDPGNWGRLISQSAQGRSSTYERYNADGSKTLTHVYWTKEAAIACPSCDHRYDRQTPAAH